MTVTANRIMFAGPTGCGKTTRLLAVYKELISGGVPSDTIQVFVLNREAADYWKQNVQIAASGFLRIDTYFSFVRRELQHFWHVVEKDLTEGEPTLEPVFLTMETAQYMMELCIGEMRREGRFLDERFRSQPSRMALQLAETMQIAAISRLDAGEIAQRLAGAWGKAGSPVTIYEDVRQTIELYRRRCLSARMLDYALSLELYNTLLLSEPAYQQRLRQTVQHLLVDDTEEILPAAMECIMQLMPAVKTAHFGYCTDGGHSIFFGAHPELARESLIPLCKYVELGVSRTSTLACSCFGDALAAKILNEEPLNAPGGVVLQHIVEDLRGQMVRSTGESLLDLLERGVEPGDIAIVAPFIDKALEHTLSTMLSGKGYSIRNKTRSQRLIDLPFARALVTLLITMHPEWQIPNSAVDMAQLLALLLELDPIRSMILAEHVLEKGWVELDQVSVHSRVGYAASGQYNFVCRRLADLVKDVPIAELIQQVFGRLLYPLQPAIEEVEGCRHLAQSAQHFQQFALAFLPLPKIGWHFIQMIQKGTIAAKGRRHAEPKPRAVNLTTAYALLMDKGTSYRYQFWLDLSRDAWFRSDAKELTNPHVLSLRWREGEVWTDAINERLRREKTARTVKAMARRCRSGMIVAESACDSYGSEREGELAAHLSDLEGTKELME